MGAGMSMNPMAGRGGNMMSSSSGSSSSLGGGVVPMEALEANGVKPTAVAQLAEVRRMFLRDYGLDLAVVRPTAGPANAMSSMGMTTSRAAHEELSAVGVAVDAGDNGVMFSIPKSCAGSVIGKGGQLLKDLQAEFGVRVYVEKEGDVPGMRVVVLRPCTTAASGAAAAAGAGAGTEGGNGDGAMQRCQERILSLVAADLAAAAAAAVAE